MIKQAGSWHNDYVNKLLLFYIDEFQFLLRFQLKKAIELGNIM